MKNKIYAAVAILFIGSTVAVNGQDKDAVKEAHKFNEAKSNQGLVNEDVAEFLVMSADARMMDSQEGKLATQKGTTSAIRKYGKWMMKDQAILLKDIKKLAAARRIALPISISNKKENGREDLAAKNGEDFDEKFIKMMIIDHERDIRLFEKATEFDDIEVNAFAKKYLPTLQAHLVKIKNIRAETK